MKPVPVALWENRYQDPDALKAALQGRNGREWLLRWLPSRAHDNGMFILFSNGVGLDNGEVRTGNAMIIDPMAALLQKPMRLKTPGLRHAGFKPADHVHGPTLDSRQTARALCDLSQNQGYERDAAARFSTEVPQFSDKTQH